MGITVWDSTVNAMVDLDSVVDLPKDEVPDDGIIDKEGSERLNYRCIMYVQQLEYLNFDLDELPVLLSDSFPYPDYQWAYIIHDKDQEDGELVKPHIHLSIYARKGVSLKFLSNVLSDTNTAHFEFFRNKKALFYYLTHDTVSAQLQGKYLYNASDVIANFNYLKYGDRNSAETKLILSEIIEKVANGEISRHTIFTDNEIYSLYASNVKRFEDAIKAYKNKRKYLDSITDGEKVKKK